MLHPDIAATLAQSHTADLASTGDTATLTRATHTKNPAGFGTIAGAPSVIAADLPCRIKDGTSVVDRTGGSVKDTYDYLITLPAGTQAELGDTLTITRASGAVVECTVTRHAATVLATAARVYCQANGGK